MCFLDFAFFSITLFHFSIQHQTFYINSTFIVAYSRTLVFVNFLFISCSISFPFLLDPSHEHARFPNCILGTEKAECYMTWSDPVHVSDRNCFDHQISILYTVLTLWLVSSHYFSHLPMVYKVLKGTFHHTKLHINITYFKKSVSFA